MRFSTLYSSPQGCTCYDNQNRQCAPQYWCNECRNNPSNPNCNMRVGNRIVSRYQTQNGGNIYATPTNRFRNSVGLMPMGTDSGGFGMPMGNSGRDSYQNAVGMGNPTIVAPAFGGTKIPSADVNSNRCMKACNKNQLQGVFINGKCYCSTHKQFAEWKEKNFSNAIGGCNWLFCPEGYTKRGCRCVPNEHLPKRVKKKMNLDFSNFINNPFAKARKTEMSDAKCRRICDRSKHTAILVDGNCICASINDIADFQKDKGYHNAVDRKRGCEEQVTCPNGFIAKVVGVNCMCVPVDKPSAISPANRVVNRR